MSWWCRKSTDGAGTGMLDVAVLQEIYRWCRDSNPRCGVVSKKAIDCAGTVTLDMMRCGNATGGEGTRILEVVQRQD